MSFEFGSNFGTALQNLLIQYNAASGGTNTAGQITTASADFTLLYNALSANAADLRFYT